MIEKKLTVVKGPKTSGTGGDGSTGSDNSNLSKNAQIELYLSTNYLFRYNTIKSQTEFKGITETEFKPLEPYFINGFRRELDQRGINTSPANIDQILKSPFASRIHPVKDYFNQLPKWDQHDHIADLCATVSIKDDSELWYIYFTKWITAAVANVFNDKNCLNHCCLVLTGEQGKFKTTWLNHLCPKPLFPSYLYCGRPDINNDRTINQLVAEMFIINLDDVLHKINVIDENLLKNYITKPFVTYDKKFDPYIREYSHLASFCASINGNEFLTDPTGNRRFLPFEVTGIDIDKATTIDMNLIYSQCMHLIRSGYEYWINQDELAELERNNVNFQLQSLEEQLLIEYFAPPDERDLATNFYSTAKIKSLIELHTRQKLSTKKLGSALVKNGFEKWQKTFDNKQVQWVWSVIEKTGPEIQNQTLK